MNIAPAWQKGYTGKGVVVSILDDGIQTNHPDLVQNYVSIFLFYINVDVLIENTTYIISRLAVVDSAECQTARVEYREYEIQNTKIPPNRGDAVWFLLLFVCRR